MSPSDSIIEEDHVTPEVSRGLVLRLIRFLAPYWRSIALASFLSLLIAGLTLAGPKIVQLAIDEHIAVGDARGVLRLSLLYLATIVSILVLEYCREWMTAYVGQHAMFDLRRELFAHIQRLSLPFFDRNPVGRVMTRITSDVAALNEMFSQGLTTLAGDLFLLVAIAGILLYKNWLLALLIFSTIPVLIGAAGWFRKTVRAGFREVRASLSRLNGYLQENLSGMRTVQAYNRQAKNYAQFHELNEQYRQANLKTIFAYAVFLPIVELLAAVAMALIVWYGGIASLDGTITVGTIVLFIQYCSRFYQPVKDLSDKFNVLQTAIAASERIFKLLDEVPEVQAPPNPKRFERLEREIEFQNVWFAYKDEQWVLRDISFEVKRGETVALVGATGSGKTTIANLLTRFYDVQKGAVLVDGVDVRELDPLELRQRMAVVLQDNFLFSGDIESNIRLGNESITDEKLHQAAEFVNAADFISNLPDGYKAEVLERGATISVGQKQLLAFARALAFNPEILILDEATASIDTETELLIQDALAKLLKGRTSIVIAHRLSTIQNADRILVMSKGKIRESGTHAELLQQGGLYRKLYELQYRAAPTRKEDPPEVDYRHNMDRVPVQLYTEANE
ncbi:MAG: ABC transporter ATP-binding protein [Candidatus Sumerlaeaceae bacterium]